jgi:hypothetical protein
MTSVGDIENERRIIAKLMQEQQTRENKSWSVCLAVEEIPAAIGHYAVYDGLDITSAGVSANMRKSVQEVINRRDLKRPVFQFLYDIAATKAR